MTARHVGLLVALGALAAVHVADDSATFANPQHDFPQTIAYARRSADSVVATVSGRSPRGPRGFQVPFRRVACPGGPK